jgi:hypothetical protein
MAFTSADIDALDRAIASGELMVRHGERQVTYRSLDELIKARATIAAEIAASAATSRAYPRYQRATFADDE